MMERDITTAERIAALEKLYDIVTSGDWNSEMLNGLMDEYRRKSNTQEVRDFHLNTWADLGHVFDVLRESKPLPAQTERDAEADEDTPYAVQAMDVIADLKRQLAEANSAGQTSQNLWLDEKERYNSLYKDYILQQRNIEELEAERDALASKLAAAEALLPCPDCEGDGVIAVGFDNDPNVYEAIEAECPRCRGTGKYTATPQPAPASELAAAVKPVYGANYKPSGEWLHFDPKDDE